VKEDLYPLSPPDSICNLTNLQVVSLASNQISELQEMMKNYYSSSLSRVKEDICPLSPPDNISNLTNLRIFSCTNNKIKVVPNNIGNLTNYYNSFNEFDN